MRTCGSRSPGKRKAGNPLEENQEAILVDLQTLADGTAKNLRDFVNAMRGERLKKEHLDSAMEGVTYSGVSETLNCLCVRT